MTAVPSNGEHSLLVLAALEEKRDYFSSHTVPNCVCHERPSVHPLLPLRLFSLLLLHLLSGVLRSQRSPVRLQGPPPSPPTMTPFLRRTWRLSTVAEDLLSAPMPPRSLAGIPLEDSPFDIIWGIGLDAFHRDTLRRRKWRPKSVW